MNSKKYKSLELNKLKNKQFKIITSEEALKPEKAFHWSQDVLIGIKKVVIDKDKN